MVWRLSLLLLPLPVGCLLSSSIIKPNPPYTTKAWSYIRTGTVSTVQNLAGHESASSAAQAEQLVNDLLRFFQGEFDNYDQVVEDRAAGMTAGPGGGHEHIHCSLKLLPESQLPEQILRQDCRRGSTGQGEERGHAEGLSVHEERPLAVAAAKYFFNGDASVVFRYRLYSFHECVTPEGEAARGDAVMRLWRLHPSVEKRLRAAGYDLTRFDWQDEEEVAERMYGCEIYWSCGGQLDHGTSDNNQMQSSRREKEHVLPRTGVLENQQQFFVERDGDGVDHEGSTETTEGKDGCTSESAICFWGVMGHDDQGTWVSSQNVRGLDILIKDDLRVWADRLWVNDRGFDREGKFVYGNQRGVPYKLRRVTSMADGGSTASSLEWTLGAGHRTPELYAAKMAAIGVVPGERYGPPAISRQPSDGDAAGGGQR